MKYQFFTIPVQASDAAAMALNQFLAEQRILAVEREFIADGCNSAWAFCIGYDEAGHQPAAAKTGKVEYMTKPSGGGCVSSRVGESSPVCLPYSLDSCSLKNRGFTQ